MMCCEGALCGCCCWAWQVPFRLLKSFHKIQQRLVRELEKKFSGKDVVVVANRRILPPPTSGKSNARPRSRTLTAVRGKSSSAATAGGKNSSREQQPAGPVFCHQDFNGSSEWFSISSTVQPQCVAEY